MIIAGLDWSINSPAICIHRGKKWLYSKCVFHFFDNRKKKWNIFPCNFNRYKVQSYFSNEEKFYNTVKWGINILKRVDLIVLEDYSFGSKGKTFTLAENTGLLKHYLWKLNKKVFLVSPQTVKKFVISGNASKYKLEEEFIKETGVDIRKNLSLGKKSLSPISDIIDSYYLCKWIFNKKELYE